MVPVGIYKFVWAKPSGAEGRGGYTLNATEGFFLVGLMMPVVILMTFRLLFSFHVITYSSRLAFPISCHKEPVGSGPRW